MKLFTLILLSFLLSASISYAKISDIILSQKPAVVTIYTEENNKVIATGSGFISDPNGIIVTNYHVIEKWEKSTKGLLYVKRANGKFLEATVIIAIDKTRDVALIRVKETNLPFIKINSSKPKQGDDVVVIGSPLGLETTVTDGIISGIRGEDGFLQITAPISLGSSGSPVLNSNGEAIGVATLIYTGGQNVNFAIPAAYVESISNLNNTPLSEISTEAKGLKKAARIDAPDDSAEMKAVIIPDIEMLPHKGTVVSTVNSGGYTYIECENIGVKKWLAMPQLTISVGDVIEYPDTPPLKNFESVTLKKKFDAIYFVPGIRVAINKGQASANTGAKPIKDLLVEVDQFLKDNDYASATTLINRAIEDTPNNAGLYFKRAEINLAQRIFWQDYYDEEKSKANLEHNKEICQNAYDDLNAAILLNPNNEEYFIKRARLVNDTIYCNYKTNEIAITDYSSAIKINPNKADYYLEKGFIHLEMKDLTNTYECATKALAIDINSARGYFLLGKYFEEKQDYVKSLYNYKKYIIKSKRGGFSATSGVESVFKVTKKWDEAVKVYTDLIKHDPKNDWFYTKRGDYYEKLEMYKKAIEDHTKAISINPNKNAYYYVSRGECFLLDGNKQKALIDFKKACELEAQSACETVTVIKKDINRGDNWVKIAETDSVNYYFDKKNKTKSENGIYKAWFRSEITDREKYNEALNLGKNENMNTSHTMLKFALDCDARKSALSANHVYSSDGSILSSYENNVLEFSDVVPGSIGSTFLDNVCKADAEKKAPPKKVKMK